MRKSAHNFGYLAGSSFLKRPVKVNVEDEYLHVPGVVFNVDLLHLDQPKHFLNGKAIITGGCGENHWDL